jgi:hypothetical protein
MRRILDGIRKIPHPEEATLSKDALKVGMYLCQVPAFAGVTRRTE